MTPAITKQFIDLASRFAKHGIKKQFLSGLTTIQIDGKDDIQVKVYFGDTKKEIYSVFFYKKYAKIIDVSDYSETITFNYKTTSRELSEIIKKANIKITELELTDDILDEENIKIKSEINTLEENIQELRKSLKL